MVEIGTKSLQRRRIDPSVRDAALSQHVAVVDHLLSVLTELRIRVVGLLKAAATVAEHLQGAATPPTGAVPATVAPSPADVAAAGAARAIGTRIAAVSTELAGKGPRLHGVTTCAAGSVQAQDSKNAGRIAAVAARRDIQPTGRYGKPDGDPGDDVPPEDPQQFYDWWQSLSPAQKDRVYSYDHDIGNHPGMPWDPADHLGKDHYNQLHLPELEQQTHADIDRM
ncbi:MAG: hypothetical protein QOE94_1335 [Mycobacterium sp.]|nr:hypothetical protein [Mycobacterium sp.]